MADAGSLAWVAERLAAMLAPLATARKDQRELRDNALRAISHALSETTLYYGGLERGKKRDRELEDQLARYWSAAAIPMRHIDPELALVCDRKARYWVSPDRWTRAKIVGAGIQLERLHKLYSAMLKPRSVVQRVFAAAAKMKNDRSRAKALRAGTKRLR